MIRALLICAVLAAPASAATQAQLDSLFSYIKKGWTTLSRSPKDIVSAAADDKVKAGKKPLVYVPADEDPAKLAAEWQGVEVAALPKDGKLPEREGLLYLPNAYVVPGGRFNEMYGWDSYFILVGLLRDGETALAKGMTENFLYEVERYGKVLNANRTYYLTRSQPPFLTQMVLGVYAKTGDKEWLRRAVPALEKYYAVWTTGDKKAGTTGLSRYYDEGEGPAPEVTASEKDAQGRTHYDRVREFYRKNEIPGYEESRQYDAKKDQLTPFFYKNDRSMRESGFDPSDRFGPFNSEVVDIAPVCLNTLLYRFETELGDIHAILGDADGQKEWKRLAAARKKAINALMWDEKSGLYFDYDFAKSKRRSYEFVTAFYPLWAGIADPKQAARVRANLAKFERPGGLMTSTRVTGKQWDAPYGWAPMQMLAVEGLRRYGFGADADRVAAAFLSMILKDFVEHNALLEKYDVVARRSSLGSGIKYGYSSNEIGFGWTNAAVLDLYAKLSPAARAAVLKNAK